MEFTFVDARTHQSRILQGDVLDPTFMRDVVRGHDALVHAAALHGRHVRDHSIQQFLRTNVEGTGNVLDASVAAGVKHVIVMSSTSVYGLSASTPPARTVFVDESTPCNPRDSNDLCKVLSEELAAYVSRRDGLRVTILRSGRFFVDDLLQFNLAKLTGAVDVADVAQAVVRSLAEPPDGLEVFCIASRARFGAADVSELSTAADEVIEERYPGAKAALAAYGCALPKRLHRVVSIAKATAAIGFQPEQNFERFIELLTSHNGLKSGERG
jgi:nucleoside-diphosphate-sugar epimerase